MNELLEIDDICRAFFPELRSEYAMPKVHEILLRLKKAGYELREIKP